MNAMMVSKRRFIFNLRYILGYETSTRVRNQHFNSPPKIHQSKSFHLKILSSSGQRRGLNANTLSAENIENQLPGSVVLVDGLLALGMEAERSEGTSRRGRSCDSLATMLRLGGPARLKQVCAGLS